MKDDKSITLADGYLTLTDVYGQPKLIEELSMARYERFFKLWHVAMTAAVNANPKATFMYSWVWCDHFRDALEEALSLFGLKADDLTPQQLRQLLIGTNGQDGLLFQLHQDAPGEVQLGERPSQPTKPKRKGWLQRLVSAASTRLDSLQARLASAWLALTSSPLEKSNA